MFRRSTDSRILHNNGNNYHVFLFPVEFILKDAESKILDTACIGYAINFSEGLINIQSVNKKTLKKHFDKNHNRWYVMPYNIHNKKDFLQRITHSKTVGQIPEVYRQDRQDGGNPSLLNKTYVSINLYSSFNSHIERHAWFKLVYVCDWIKNILFLETKGYNLIDKPQGPVTDTMLIRNRQHRFPSFHIYNIYNIKILLTKAETMKDMARIHEVTKEPPSALSAPHRPTRTQSKASVTLAPHQLERTQSTASVTHLGTEYIVPLDPGMSTGPVIRPPELPYMEYNVTRA
jgi:hypothetical protein